MPRRKINENADESAVLLSGVVRCYHRLFRMEDGPEPATARDAEQWAQTFEATWREAQQLMAQARVLGWDQKLDKLIRGQPKYRARRVYATCFAVRLSVTRTASEALDAAAALVYGFHYKGEIPANLDHLHDDLAYALASAQIRAEKRSAGP